LSMNRWCTLSQRCQVRVLQLSRSCPYQRFVSP
jgi:hypothetical protein